MTATKVRESAHMATFLLLLDQHQPGDQITVETLRSDLDAAQIPASALGGLFRAAVARGELTNTSSTVVQRRTTRRHGRACIYIRATPKETQ